jgi:hypothetical protein
MRLRYLPCRDCRQTVLWTKTAKNRAPMRLEEDDDNGNVRLDGHGLAHVFRDHAAALDADEDALELDLGPTFIPHAAVCPVEVARREEAKAARPQEALQESLL